MGLIVIPFRQFREFIHSDKSKMTDLTMSLMNLENTEETQGDILLRLSYVDLNAKTQPVNEVCFCQNFTYCGSLQVVVKLWESSGQIVDNS